MTRRIGTVIFARQGRPGRDVDGVDLFDYWQSQGNTGTPAQMVADNRGDAAAALIAATDAVTTAGLLASVTDVAAVTAEAAWIEAENALDVAAAALVTAESAATAVAGKAGLFLASSEAEATAAPAGMIAIFDGRVFTGGIELLS